MYKPMLTVMVGLSGSGKSTIARTELADENTVIVSSDAIREELCGAVEDQSKNVEVFKLFHERIRRNLEKKKNVIADATNLTMKSRRAILMTVNGLEDVFKRCYIVPKPYEQCLEDNRLREHPVPDEVLAKQIRRFQIPFIEEGFHTIIFHRMPENCEANDIPDMRGFDQQNPHHTLDLYNHCTMAVRLFSAKYVYPTRFLIGALYHDIGKMYTQTFDESGIAHYYQHQSVGSYHFLTAMCSIGEETVLDECFIINYHMLPFYWETKKAHQKWRKRFGEEKYHILMAFHECDMRAR